MHIGWFESINFGRTRVLTSPVLQNPVRQLGSPDTRLYVLGSPLITVAFPLQACN